MSVDGQCPFCGEAIDSHVSVCPHCESVLKRCGSGSKRKSSPFESSKVKRQKKAPLIIGLPTILLALALSIKGWHNLNVGLNFFGGVNIECGNKRVVQTLKKLVEDSLATEVRLSAFTTEDKGDNYRICFAMVDIPAYKVHGQSVQYQVRKADDGKTFTVFIE